MVTGGDGAFLFPDLLAGTYDLTVKMDGFKPYEQKGIAVGATERIGLKPITLQVGGPERTDRRRRGGAAGADDQRIAIGSCDAAAD